MENKKLELDPEERALLDSYEADQWVTVDSAEARVRYEQTAADTFRKDRRVNIRLSSRDLELIQKRALEEGIPYQTLIASVLHKFVTGRVVEKAST